MYRVSREFDFCYGHRLIGYNGKCARLHGHNGSVLVVLEVDTLDDIGMAVDFAEVKRVVNGWINENIDHRMILYRDDPIVEVLKKSGDEPYVLDRNPTAENIARLIFDSVLELGLPVVEVRFLETPACSATYRPD